MDLLSEISELFDKSNGRELTALYTKKTDDLLINIFNSIKSKNPIVLIAVGGYGRAELAPFSDIDIMFFAKDKSDSKKVETVLYQLWDKGLTVGHSFRTAEECIIEAKKDIRTHTSLLESRFIAGDKELYDYFTDKVYSEIAYKNQKSFIKAKLSEMAKRHIDYGGSVFLLEPNIKEGQGCLRDVHTALWLSNVVLRLNKLEQLAGVIEKNELRRFLKAYDFLLKIRFCLHIINERKNDSLSFNLQSSVALKLGFRDSKKFLGSERFMRYFYLKANVIKAVTKSLIEACVAKKFFVQRRFFNSLIKKRITDNFYLCTNVIAHYQQDLFRKEPWRIIEAYYVFSKTGRDFSKSLRYEIKQNLFLINKKIRNSSRAAACFIKILKSDRVYETLNLMHETGVLGRFIPEFGALRSLVVYEPYHRYTVDEHTLIAIKNLELLRNTKFKNLEYLSKIINGLEEKEILFMALLFHDIGKAAGRYHQGEGYRIIKNILERFNIRTDKRQRIEFLVKNHILMSLLALKREIEDTELISQFADAVSDEESLKSIYLMTYADMSAVNPGFWTEWKAYLLNDLFDHTLNYLKGIRRNTQKHINKILSSYIGTDKKELDKFIKQMPDRYMISTSIEKVYSDFKLVSQLKNDIFTVEINSKTDSLTEIIIATWDRPGLFSKIVGFLSSKWLNIVSARLYTGTNGLVIDKIQISNWKELWWDGMDDTIKKGLRTSIFEDLIFDLTYSRKESVSIFGVFVEIDNETSSDSTIAEFFSTDRLGLLYDVSNLFLEKGLNIISAKINTELGIAQDTFYIQDAGKKLDGIKTFDLVSSIWEKLKR
ncbi:MAG: [protein-PII] uridylyltransferase [Nitrospiraceae bacterium]|nr:[protein-PII] uridylyltransferase [Nitrospiraceae bacterium]